MSPGAMVTMVKKEEEPLVKTVKKEEGGLQKRIRCSAEQVRDINLTAKPD